MTNSYYKISLNIYEHGSHVSVKAKKGDTGRLLYINFTDGSKPYVITSECRAVFTAKRADGTKLFDDCSIIGNTICYEFTPQTTSVVGKSDCEIKLYGSDDKLITSARFAILVEDAVYNDGDETESDVVRTTPQSLTEAQKAQARENIGVESAERYCTERKEFTNAENLKTEDIYELYRGLGAVENTLCDFKGEETDLHEFVFSVGDYNTSGYYWIPDDVHKPTFLVTSGIHGGERPAVLSTYRFFEDLVKGKNLPSYLREGAIFKVVPVVNPWGFDNNNRGNKNGININRNFDWEWEEQVINGNNGVPNLSGTSVASEKETQAVTNWLNANTNAVVFIDMHCSGIPTDYAGIVGTMIPSVVRAKKVALRGIDKIIPYWKSLLDSTEKIKFSYSVYSNGQNDPVDGTFKRMVGPSTYYASDKLGIPAFALEVISKKIDGIYQFSTEQIAIGAECLGNVVLETYKQHTMDVVAVKKYASITDALAGNNETEYGTVVAYEAYSMLNIVLTEDMPVSEGIEVTRDCTIHLNGHKLSFTDGKHIHLTSGKLTINGAVSGSEIAKAIENGTGENLVSVDGVEGTELHLFGGVYSVTGTATSAIIPIRAGNGKVAKMTISGCTVNMNCSGLAVYGVQATDDTTIDNCTFDVQTDTCTNYTVIAIKASAKSNTAIRNSTITINGGDVAGVAAVHLTSQNSVVENCTILASVDKEGAECYGIGASKTGSCVTVNDCEVEANGEESANVYAIYLDANTEAWINGGHYQGSNKALNLLGTAYINGEQVDGTSYTAKEYDFSV